MYTRSVSSRTAAALAALAVSAACTTTHTVRVNPSFAPTLVAESKRDIGLAVLVDSATRAHVMEQRKSALGSTTIYKVHVGTVLDTAARALLMQSFARVRTVSSAAAAGSGERVLQIRFGESSSFQLAKTTVTPQKATIQLEVSLLDGSGRPAWHTSISETREGRKAGKALAGALIGGIVGGGMSQNAYIEALGIAVHDALQAALETLAVRLEDRMKTTASGAR